MSPPTASTTSLIDKPDPPKLQRSFSLPANISKDEKKTKGSWRDRFRARKEPAVPGKEKWRDASLPEEERWKEWHKQKDAERKVGYTRRNYSLQSDTDE